MKRINPLTKQDEIDQILSKLRKLSTRDYIISIIALTTGLRISDILNLQIWQFRDHHDIEIVEQKTKKRKYILISKKLRNIILKYCKNKRSYEYLFKNERRKTSKNNPITRQTYYLSINKHIKLKDKKINAHMLRKTYAYYVLNETNNLPLVMKCLNHSSQSVTLDYLGINQQQINNVNRRLEKRFLK